MTSPMLRKPVLIRTLVIAAGIAAVISLYGAGSAAISGQQALPSDSAAPEFTGIDLWLNSEPLDMAKLRGKVVLVDFWTYSCINCAHTLPALVKWHRAYKDQGLVVIGVHTPEFPYERETAGLQTAMQRFHIEYPVAQDNHYATWQAYNNQYWPAQYLIDRNGRIVRQHFGEGGYEEMEQAIREQLAKNASAAALD
jgi:thiol-disulfide isomerase/thioredoxin